MAWANALPQPFLGQGQSDEPATAWGKGLMPNASHRCTVWDSAPTKGTPSQARLFLSDPFYETSVAELSRILAYCAITSFARGRRTRFRGGLALFASCSTSKRAARWDCISTRVAQTLPAPLRSSASTSSLGPLACPADTISTPEPTTSSSAQKFIGSLRHPVL